MTIFSMRDEMASLSTVGGSGVASLGDPRDRAFARRLREALHKVDRVNALLALRTDPRTAEARFCFAGGDYDVFDCAAPEPLAARPVMEREVARMTVVNMSDEPRYLYVFGIDQSYGISLVMPPNGGRDPAVAPRQPVQRTIVPIWSGLFRFVAVATDAPIDAAAFEQPGIGDAEGPARCFAPLVSGQCAAAGSGRDPSLPRVVKWSAVATSAAVESKDIM